MRILIQHWLRLRVRLICAAAFLIGSLLPPYVPETALSQEEFQGRTSQFLFVEEGFLMKTSSLGQQGARLAYSEGLVHTVREGDNLQKLAQKYGVSSQTIEWANTLKQGAALHPGDELLILPVNGVVHAVKRGQTIGQIAKLYAVPEESIARQNRLDGGFIVAGQQLIVPGGKPLLAGGPTEEELQFAKKLLPKNIALKITSKAELAERTAQSIVPSMQGEMRMPCNDCFFTQYYHPGHYAVDIQERGGGPILSAEAGTVIRADTGWNGGYGNVIEIDHGNGLVTLYAHNKELYVSVGDKVVRGQKIAWMGNTGLVHGPTGIHIHFEVRYNGVKKNPLLYLQ